MGDFIRHKVPPPCGRDCKDRVVGCAASCAKWAAYVVQRDKEYGKRVEAKMISDAIRDGYDRLRSRRT